jgi:AcrR family transcriptional regulator
VEGRLANVIAASDANTTATDRHFADKDALLRALVAGG